MVFRRKYFKEQVAQKFGRASSSYIFDACVQKKCASKLAHFIENNVKHQPNTILDLGTGPGFVIEALCSRNPYAYYTANDLSQNMLQCLLTRNAHIRHLKPLLGDMDVISMGRQDLITSSFALHWSENPHSLLARCVASAKVTGMCVLLPESLASIRDVYRDCGLLMPDNTYVDVSFCQTLAKEKGCSLAFKSERHEVAFSNGRDFLTYLKNIGGRATARHNKMSNVTKLVSYSKSFVMEYNVGFLVWS